MAPRPGTNVILRDFPPPRSAPTDTGVWFVAGLTQKGEMGPQLVTSMSEFVRKYGDRVSYSLLYDSVDTFFREGGAKCYISRVVGPAATASTLTLMDNQGTPAATFKVDAVSPGDWGNSLNITVLAGVAAGSFIIVVTHDALGELERSLEMTTKAEAIAWSENSDNIRLTDLASAFPPALVSNVSLSGGADDRASVTDPDWKTALTKFTKDLGPGQVSMPGRTSAVSHTDTLNHAYMLRRCALLDLPDSSSVSALLTAADNVRTVDARYGSAWAPWVRVPGLSAGYTRIIPPSSMIAGIIARNDASLSPNVPSAGMLGQSVFALGVSQPAWTDFQRDDLNTGGVDIIRVLYGGVRAYGYRTLVDPNAEPNWINFGNSRLYMDIANRADIIAEQFVLREIDGRGIVISQFGSALNVMLNVYWVAGSLYGETPAEAFYVDVGPQVNTPETISNNELRAILSVRMSPMAELVTIEIVKRAITENVA